MSTLVKESVRDAWGDPAFAAAWSHGGGVARTNPNRDQQLNLLAALVARRCHDAAAAPHVANPTVLDLGVGSGLAARRMLASMPSSAKIVGVDASSAMLDILRAAAPEAEDSSRLTTHHVGFGDLAARKDDLLAPGETFAAAVAVQSLHEKSRHDRCQVDEATKRDALRFARDTLDPDGALYVLDRHNVDLDSRLAPDRAALWDALHTDDIAAEDRWPWHEYAAYMAAKLDDAWASPDACVALCQDVGFHHAEVLFVAFNRFLVAARKP